MEVVLLHAAVLEVISPGVAAATPITTALRICVRTRSGFTVAPQSMKIDGQ